jgi:hypothetical protein
MPSLLACSALHHHLIKKGTRTKVSIVLESGEAREMFRRFPKAAYMTEIESWRELPDDRIEFTMRRLPSAD